MRTRVEQEWKEIDKAFDRLPDQGRAHRVLFAAIEHGDRGGCITRLQELLDLATVEQARRFALHRIRQPRPYYNRIVALHEAAHAVAAIVFRHNLRYVTLRPKEEWVDGWAVSRGTKPFKRQVNGTARRRWSRQRLMRAADQHVIALLVGCSAMEFADPSWSVAVDANDYLAATDLVEKVHGDRWLDEYERLWSPADDFVRCHWLAITAVGQSLFERGTLTGREVRRVMEAVEKTKQAIKEELDGGLDSSEIIASWKKSFEKWLRGGRQRHHHLTGGDHQNAPQAPVSATAGISGDVAEEPST